MPVTSIPGTLIRDGSITDVDVAAANKDGTAGTPSMRTLGTGSQQAAAGDDARLSDDRTASGLRTATTIVAIASATAPTAGQILVATSGTAANWQNQSGLAPANFVDNEVPTGTINGSNATFTLASTPSAGTNVKLYLNGTYMRQGASEDYQISGTTITFNAGQIPQTGDTLVANYRI
jgi:hypothetical protein